MSYVHLCSNEINVDQKPEPNADLVVISLCLLLSRPDLRPLILWESAELAGNIVTDCQTRPQ